MSGEIQNCGLCARLACSSNSEITDYNSHSYRSVSFAYLKKKKFFFKVSEMWHDVALFWPISRNIGLRRAGGWVVVEGGAQHLYCLATHLVCHLSVCVRQTHWPPSSTWRDWPHFPFPKKPQAIGYVLLPIVVVVVQLFQKKKPHKVSLLLAPAIKDDLWFLFNLKIIHSKSSCIYLSCNLIPLPWQPEEEGSRPVSGFQHFHRVNTGHFPLLFWTPIMQMSHGRVFFSSLLQHFA